MLMNMTLAFNVRVNTLAQCLSAVHRFWLMDADSFFSGAIDGSDYDDDE